MPITPTMSGAIFWPGKRPSSRLLQNICRCRAGPVDLQARGPGRLLHHHARALSGFIDGRLDIVKNATAAFTGHNLVGRSHFVVSLRAQQDVAAAARAVDDRDDGGPSSLARFFVETQDRIGESRRQSLPAVFGLTTLRFRRVAFGFQLLLFLSYLCAFSLQAGGRVANVLFQVLGL